MTVLRGAEPVLSQGLPLGGLISSFVALDGDNCAPSMAVTVMCLAATG